MESVFLFDNFFLFLKKSCCCFLTSFFTNFNKSNRDANISKMLVFIWVRYTDHSTYCCQMWNNYYEYHGMTTAHYETWTSYVSSHFGISKTTHCSRCETWTKCFWYFSFVSSRIFIAIPVWFNCYCFDHLFLVLLQIDDWRSFWLVLIIKEETFIW